MHAGKKNDVTQLYHKRKLRQAIFVIFQKKGRFNIFWITFYTFLELLRKLNG